jgi:hypothetical protein
MSAKNPDFYTSARFTKPTMKKIKEYKKRGESVEEFIKRRLRL